MPSLAAGSGVALCYTLFRTALVGLISLHQPHQPECCASRALQNLMADMCWMVRTVLAAKIAPMETQPPQLKSGTSRAPSGARTVTETDSQLPAAAGPRTRVLCVDDSPDMADMLERLIGSAADMVSVGTLGNAVRICEEVISRRADVVVLDLTMPGPDPLAAIALLAERAPLCRVIAFSGYDDRATREAARRAGAWELVSKSGEPTDIVCAIRRVASGPAGAKGIVK